MGRWRTRARSGVSTTIAPILRSSSSRGRAVIRSAAWSCGRWGCAGVARRWVCVVADGEELTEVGVDGDDASLVAAGGRHDVSVGGAEEVQVADVDGVMSSCYEQSCYAGREGFVDEELQPVGRSGISRTSTAAAAYRRESWMSASVRWGNSARMSSCPSLPRPWRRPSRPGYECRAHTARHP